MKSLTQWLQQFVEEVRLPTSGAAAAAAFDHSLAAAFVSVPPHLPSAASPPVTHDPLFGPALATPPRASQPPSVWPTPPRQTPAPSNPLGGTAAARRNIAAGAAGSSPRPSERSASNPLAPLAAAFGPLRSATAASPPGTPSEDWPTTARPTPQAAATTAAPSAVPVAPPDHSTADWSLDPPLERAQPAPHPSDSNLSAAAVLPLAELLRDLVPASPFEARLESLWQQRAAALAGGAPPGAGALGWPDSPWSQSSRPSSAWPEVPVGPQGGDWSELARRLADLEAAQGE